MSYEHSITEALLFLFHFISKILYYEFKRLLLTIDLIFCYLEIATLFLFDINFRKHKITIFSEVLMLLLNMLLSLRCS